MNITWLFTFDRLHSIRLLLLDHLTRALPQLREVGGVRAIPFMQVVLALTSDLESDLDKDKATLDALLTALIGQLDMQVSRFM